MVLKGCVSNCVGVGVVLSKGATNVFCVDRTRGVLDGFDILELVFKPGQEPALVDLKRAARGSNGHQATEEQTKREARATN